MSNNHGIVPEQRSDSERMRGQVLDFAKESLRLIIDAPVPVITADSVIGEELLLKSIQLVEFQIALEEEFDVTLDPLEIVERGSVGHIVQYVLEELAAAAPLGGAGAVGN